MRNFISNILKNFYRIKLIYKTKSIINRKSNITLRTVLEGKNKINENVILDGCKIGFGTYIGNNTILTKTYVGRYCSIAEDVKVIFGKHPTKKFVSTHPSFYSIYKQSGFTYINNQKFNEMNYLYEDICVDIGNDVWIGEGVRILSGIKIGDGAIIGARALVTKDIEPYSINVGIPAKNIGKRFDDEQIKFLTDFKWWDKGEAWIKNNADLFEDIEKFIKDKRGESYE